jgi:hypothetical protein
VQTTHTNIRGEKCIGVAAAASLSSKKAEFLQGVVSICGTSDGTRFARIQTTNLHDFSDVRNNFFYSTNQCI